MTTFDDNGYVAISWTNSSKDSEFYSWRVYRRVSGGTTWVLLSETFLDQANYTFQDWSASSGMSYEYAVVQVAARFGILVESPYVPSSTVMPIGTHYWLIDDADNANNFKLSQVTADDFTEEYEEEVYTLIGRGRKSDYGTRLGFTGSLTVELRDVTGGLTARNQRLKLELLKATHADMFIHTPFGDNWLISIGNIAFSRVPGVGVREHGTVTIPYREVS